ncbi:hypothetical protein EVAR_16272_1 [Eumeta japonica]|uniref:Uncharacterized protein n=1 Tax=Eumeta variegata TaxID=151549 RepID=A0A4C1U5U1_EUMVA|nr:hypothetical protein EVAR_16272_1 [Eumeta japonica]
MLVATETTHNHVRRFRALSLVGLRCDSREVSRYEPSIWNNRLRRALESQICRSALLAQGMPRSFVAVGAQSGSDYSVGARGSGSRCSRGAECGVRGRGGVACTKGITGNLASLGAANVLFTKLSDDPDAA